MKKNNYKKYIIIAISVVLLAGVLAALEYSGVINLFPQNGPTPLQETEQHKAEQQQKKDFIESTDQAGNTKNDGSTKEVTPSQSRIGLSAERTSSTEVTIYTKLQGYSDGSCTLTIENGTKSYQKDAPVIYQDSYSICAGFTIPFDKLGAGTWKITLIATSTNESSVSKTISYEAK